MNSMITHSKIASMSDPFMVALCVYTYCQLISGFSMIPSHRLYKMATIDHWTMIENACVHMGLATYNLLVFMTNHSVDTNDDLSAPEFDADMSEDDYMHIQTSSCMVASQNISIVIYASYAYKHSVATLHNVSFARDGVCARCHDEVNETCDEIPGHWQTEMCEECNRKMCMH
jgi:hypothetical protein